VHAQSQISTPSLLSPSHLHSWLDVFHGQVLVTIPPLRAPLKLGSVPSSVLVSFTYPLPYSASWALV